MQFDFMKEFGNVISRQVTFVKANIELNPLDENQLDGLHSENLLTMNRKAVFALKQGSELLAAHMFDGTVYVTGSFSFHSAESGIQHAIKTRQCVPHKCLQVDTKGKSLIYLSDEEKVYQCFKNDASDGVLPPSEIQFEEPCS